MPRHVQIPPKMWVLSHNSIKTGQIKLKLLSNILYIVSKLAITHLYGVCFLLPYCPQSCILGVPLKFNPSAYNYAFHALPFHNPPYAQELY